MRPCKDGVVQRRDGGGVVLVERLWAELLMAGWSRELVASSVSPSRPMLVRRPVSVVTGLVEIALAESLSQSAFLHVGNNVDIKAL